MGVLGKAHSSGELRRTKSTRDGTSAEPQNVVEAKRWQHSKFPSAPVLTSAPVRCAARTQVARLLSEQSQDLPQHIR